MQLAVEGEKKRDKKSSPCLACTRRAAARTRAAAGHAFALVPSGHRLQVFHPLAPAPHPKHTPRQLQCDQPSCLCLVLCAVRWSCFLFSLLPKFVDMKLYTKIQILLLFSSLHFSSSIRSLNPTLREASSSRKTKQSCVTTT